MSWQDYVDGYLVRSTNETSGKTASYVCEHAGMVGDDGTMWGSTSGFSLSTYSASVTHEDGTSTTAQINEFANLSNAYDREGRCSLPGGIRINREKYFVVSYDRDRGVMYLRKKNGGACVARSNRCFVIGTFSSALMMTDFHGDQVPQNPGATNRACESLQTFLRDNNL